MNREVHVRFWESLAVRFRWATKLKKKTPYMGATS
jgi:hypothetical protein